jgi:hypothetical protein
MYETWTVFMRLMRAILSILQLLVETLYFIHLSISRALIFMNRTSHSKINAVNASFN